MEWSEKKLSLHFEMLLLHLASSSLSQQRKGKLCSRAEFGPDTEFQLASVSLLGKHRSPLEIKM